MNPMLIPCEERLQTPSKKRHLSIAILKEDAAEDTRLPITPQGVEILTAQGHSIVMEEGAGLSARFADKQYADAGAAIIANRAELLKADMILKITPPTDAEADMLGEGQTIIAFALQNTRGADTYRKLAAKKCNYVALDLLCDKQNEPILSRCLGELEGMLSITTAARLLECTDNGKGVIIGGVTGVPPTEVVILGSGTATQYAARAALALGATVKIFDNNRHNLQIISQQLDGHIFTSMLHPQALTKALTSADVIIGTRTNSDDDKFFASSDYMRLLKKGAVAIDMNITAGGRFESSRQTTLESPTFVKDRIIHHCLQDITTLAPHTATIVISDIITPIISRIANNGGLHNTIKNDSGFAKGIAMVSGITTSRQVAQLYGTEHCDINLIIF